MGFHTRHLDEKWLRSVYEKSGSNGIIVLYHTTDAVTSSDKFTSSVTDLFCEGYDREELHEKIEKKFVC